MLNHVFCPDNDTYPCALLVKASAFNLREIEATYVAPLEARGISRDDIIVCALPYNPKNKASPAYIREQLAELMPALAAVGARHLYCADANYFKVLTKQRKAEPHLGYVLKCTWEDCDHMDVVLGVNHKSLIYNPANEPKLDLSVDTFAKGILGTYTGLGGDIIKNAAYPSGLPAIQDAMVQLWDHPALAVDIEAFSLRPFQAGVATISFAWNQHEGIAFACDYATYEEPQGGLYGYYWPNKPVRKVIRDFLENYPGWLKWHNATYDLKVLVATLWMKDPWDLNGLVHGLEVVTDRFDDTRIIAYLATNSTAGNELSLKALAHAFAGNWAQDEIKDIRRIPLPQLLQYNLVDALATHYVYDKYHPIMVADQQEQLYLALMKPSVKTIIQMELIGMPMCPQELQRAKQALQGIAARHRQVISQSPLIRQTEAILTERAWEKDYTERKKKAKHPDKIAPKDRATFPTRVFNPNSGPQIQVLVYEVMGLPVIDTTPTRQPAVGADTLEKLINHTDNPEYQAILAALMGNAEAQKILSTFITAFEAGMDKGDGRLWLQGSFNLGGTLSGRLSSSDPNMQNLPSGSTYGKLVKRIFQAPKGWIFCGADFASLEDRINALVTGDPNKLKVYVDGYDGHSLRTRYYWPEAFPDIDPDDPAQVNTLKDHPLRGKSKGPTFALTYQGTWQTLVNNAGFSPEEAKAIEANYHQLYAVSTRWVKDRIEQACQDGYATAAFGLRIRTPLLKQTFLGKRSTPREAEAEARSLGNAISGQSYGLLTNRAANAVMARVWESRWRFDILPIAMIHDAIYFLVRDNVDALTWLNTVLIEEMAWQELPEIRHELVKLGAELDIFYPSWADALTIPNGSSREEIHALCVDHLTALSEQGQQAA